MKSAAAYLMLRVASMLIDRAESMLLNATFETRHRELLMEMSKGTDAQHPA